MNLNAEIFEQIVTSLGAGEVTTLPSITLDGPRDQRRATRVTAGPETVVRLIPLTDAVAPGPIDISLRDVSPGGAGFVHPTSLPLDEQFVLVLPTQEGPIAILCAVAYWQPVADNLFAIGAKFNRVLRHGLAQPVMPVPVRKAV